MKNMDFETVLGGLFGIIAIIATVAEVIILGGTADAVVTGIKDLAGTMVAVMIFIIAVRNLIPKKNNLLPFEKRFKKAIDEWVEKNSNMIIKSTDDDKTHLYGLNMYTNPDGFYNAIAVTKNSGWFLRIPPIKEENYNKEDIKIYFHLNKGTFLEGLNLNDSETDVELNKIGNKFKEYIGSRYSYIKCGYKDTEKKIIINFTKPIVSDEDINDFIRVLDNMYQAYLVSANIKVVIS